MHIRLENTTYDSPTRFGYEILRDHVLPSILGTHEDEILYWAGKEVAENSQFSALMNFLYSFRKPVGVHFISKRRRKDEAFYSLKNDFGTNNQNRSCQLEAGFIAEQYQKLNGLLTECYGESNAKDGLVHFQVKWDLKTKIEV